MGCSSRSRTGAGGAKTLEIATVVSEDMEPLLGIFDRFENVIYSAIED